VSRRLALGLAVAAALLLALAGFAEGRPGGGQGYSGGGSGSSGGGGAGGGGGELIELLIWLIILKPEIGIPVALVVGVGFLFFRRQHRATRASEWDSVNLIEAPPRPPPADLERIRALDDDFSPVLFEDFLFRLYATAHRLRARPGGADELAPYLGEGPRLTLSKHEPVGEAVDFVVVGSLRAFHLVVPPAPMGPDGKLFYTKLDVEFESNMTTADGKLTMYARERWKLARAATARTRPPGGAVDFPCPNCGAKFTAGDQGQCAYCGAPTGTGVFDWLVYRIDSLSLERRPPALSKTVAEVGTEAPTVVHHQALSRMQALTSEDPQVTETALDARLRLIHQQLDRAWSALDLHPARAFVSDGLFDYLRYWTDAYRTQKLRNIHQDARIERWSIARLIRDKHYDSLTIRLWASGLDYTVKEGSDSIVTGSRRKRRTYSEYWTLIRAANRRGPIRADPVCPNCGAALNISMAGSCEYCGAHITNGEFDWVLSKIEQDESYSG
jgi:5-methylcytosine-specific restriction endonuclease McrA